MEIVRPAEQNGGSASGDRASGEPSVGSSLEHVVAASQSVITNHIELALLEARELLARTVRSVAFIGLAIVMAAAGWFAAAASGVLFVLPDATPMVQLAVFALLNGGGAIALITLAMRRGRPQPRSHAGAAIPTPAREPSTEGSRRGND